MINRRSRRKKWLLTMALGVLAACPVLIWTQHEMSVVVYNNTGQPFRNVTVSSGPEHRDMPALDVRESAIFSFRPSAVPSDVQLILDSDPPLRWNAPSLATPSVSRITLRVDAFWGVTVTVERTWAAQLSSWLE